MSKQTPFVKEFESKAKDTSIKLEDLIEIIGCPFEPYVDTPEEYDACIKLIKKHRPKQAAAIDKWLAQWNQFICEHG